MAAAENPNRRARGPKSKGESPQSQALVKVLVANHRPLALQKMLDMLTSHSILRDMRRQMEVD